jgi:NAD-dependent dihydropyrimidine dehydrogenase PreA subunit
MQVGLLDTYRRPIQNRSLFAWVASALLFSFYFLLYLPDYGYFPDYLSLALHAAGLHWMSKWNLYGSLYSLAMIVGGWFMLKKHGNSLYQRYRTYTLIGVQVLFALALPWVLKLLGHPELYLSYLWPLSYDKLFPDTLAQLPGYAAVYFVAASLIVAPVLGWYKGKRFYCSWICGCGGLAETFGDPWRHLADKSPKAWKIEQISIYSILALVLLTTGLQVADATSRAGLLQRAAGTEQAERLELATLLMDEGQRLKTVPDSDLFARYQEFRDTLSMYQLPEEVAAALPETTGKSAAAVGREVELLSYKVLPRGPLTGAAEKIKGSYAFFIGALFSGAAGVGLYPLMGSRVWCRFGCPMAAILGLIQRFGRFRITVKKDMCIACGNCSATCEMGIDVRAYAMANQDIRRASCVGCGLCAHVCPRGVLRLETKSDGGPVREEWVLDL